MDALIYLVLVLFFYGCWFHKDKRDYFVTFVCALLWPVSLIVFAGLKFNKSFKGNNNGGN